MTQRSHGRLGPLAEIADEVAFFAKKGNFPHMFQALRG